MAAPATRRPTFRGQPVDAVVDVRSKLEFWMGHLDGAVNIPVDAIGDDFATRAHVGRDDAILVYCASGGRSAAAAATLRALGFRRVVDGGGIGAASADFVP